MVWENIMFLIYLNKLKTYAFPKKIANSESVWSCRPSKLHIFFAKLADKSGALAEYVKE